MFNILGICRVCWGTIIMIHARHLFIVCYHCAIMASASASVDVSYNKKKNFTYLQLIEILQKPKLQIILWLQSLSLISLNYSCPKCGAGMVLKSVRPEKCTDTLTWSCSRRQENQRHYVSRSIRRQTFFDNSNMRIEEILQILYFWAMDYPRKIVLHELGQIGWHTVVDWYNFCRDICVDLFINNPQQIGGPGKIVEIDESKFGKRKYNRGRLVEGQWVFGGIERETRDCFLIPVPNRTSDTLIPIIQQYVRPGSTIYSDCWKAYDCLSSEGYLHLTVNHSIEFVNSENGCHTNKIEGLWSHAKRHVPATNRQKSLFLSYMAEFMYRRKYLTDSTDHFMTFVAHVAASFKPANHD